MRSSVDLVQADDDVYRSEVQVRILWPLQGEHHGLRNLLRDDMNDLSYRCLVTLRGCRSHWELGGEQDGK